MASAEIDSETVAALAGGYRDTRNHQYMELTADGTSLTLGLGGGGIELVPNSATEFSNPVGVVIAFEDEFDIEIECVAAAA